MSLYVHSIYDLHRSHNITGDVMGSVGPPTQYREHLYTHNTNSVGSRAWDSVVDGFESLVSLAEQAWLTPAQLISVVILTWTWMLCRRIEDGSHSSIIIPNHECVLLHVVYRMIN